MIAAGCEEGVAGDWNGLHMAYRDIVLRTPRLSSKLEMEPVAADLALLVAEIRNALEFNLNSKNPNTNESLCERHIQNSNPESLTESELASNKAKAKVEVHAGPTCAEIGEFNRCPRR